MYGGVVRSEEYRQALMREVERAYGVKALAMTPAQRGYFGETWKIDAQNASYFLKLVYAPAHQPVYRRGLTALAHLQANGVRDVGRVIKTLNGECFIPYDAATLALFEWIDGENLQNEQTKLAEYQILARVYAVPTEGAALARDAFGTAGADAFFGQWARLAHADDEASARVLAVLEGQRARLMRRAERLAMFAKRCAGDDGPFFITHGDAGGNIIVNGDTHTLIDWDGACLAPPERDAWFCLHWPWAMRAFNDALRGQNIAYTLRPERLAYYAYHTSFYYLTEYMQTVFDLGAESMDEALSQFFTGWIEEEIACADAMA